jgi:hypothetical protein
VAEADTLGRNSLFFGHSSFADDFSGRHGLDLSKWMLAGPDRDGAQVDRGALTVSRLLTSRQRFTAKFGHAESRIRVSRSPGVWRAFGVLDQDGRIPKGTVEPIDGGIDPTSGRRFHTYAIDWTPETVTWTVDGKPSLRLARAEPGGPLTLVFNLAADGRSAVRMVVDFVQVFTGNDGPPGTSPPATSPPTSAPETPPASPTETATASPTPSAPGASPSTSPASPTPTATVTKWAEFTDYAAGDLVSFGGATYRVLQAHTSLPGWEPPKVPDLFEKV